MVCYALKCINNRRFGSEITCHNETILSRNYIMNAKKFPYVKLKIINDIDILKSHTAK